LIYGAVFAFLQFQDHLGGPEAISYTEFDKQVDAKNVAEVFARGYTIQGELRTEKAIPAEAKPSKPGKYKRFSTERPVFAEDDLLQRLSGGGATVRATPLVEERGALANLALSFGPILLLVGFYFWMFKRQQSAMGGIFSSGKQRKPVDPESVRVTFEDVAAIAEVEDEIQELVDDMRHPEKYREL